MMAHSKLGADFEPKQIQAPPTGWLLALVCLTSPSQMSPLCQCQTHHHNVMNTSVRCCTPKADPQRFSWSFTTDPVILTSWPCHRSGVPLTLPLPRVSLRSEPVIAVFPHSPHLCRVLMRVAPLSLVSRRSCSGRVARAHPHCHRCDVIGWKSGASCLTVPPCRCWSLLALPHTLSVWHLTPLRPASASNMSSWKNRWSLSKH